MRFKLDENMPETLVNDLAAAGHDATTCAQESLAGAKDPTVAMQAAAENRILATFDLDFGDVRHYPPGSHPGIVVFRLTKQDVDSCKSAFARILASVDESEFTNNLLIVEDSRVRIRRAGGTP